MPLAGIMSAAATGGVGGAAPRFTGSNGSLHAPVKAARPATKGGQTFNDMWRAVEGICMAGSDVSVSEREDRFQPGLLYALRVRHHPFLEHRFSLPMRNANHVKWPCGKLSGTTSLVEDHAHACALRGPGDLAYHDRVARCTVWADRDVSTRVTPAARFLGRRPRRTTGGEDKEQH
jgi:hypothetical protein